MDAIKRDIGRLAKSFETLMALGIADIHAMTILGSWVWQLCDTTEFFLSRLSEKLGL